MTYEPYDDGTCYGCRSLADRIAALEQQNAEMRRVLALTYCPVPLLYSDDGELQDNRERPFIDFKRDSPDKIYKAMMERSANAMKNIQPAANPLHCRKCGAHRDQEVCRGTDLLTCPFYGIPCY